MREIATNWFAFTKYSRKRLELCKCPDLFASSLFTFLWGVASPIHFWPLLHIPMERLVRRHSFLLTERWVMASDRRGVLELLSHRGIGQLMSGKEVYLVYCYWESQIKQNCIKLSPSLPDHLMVKAVDNWLGWMMDKDVTEIVGHSSQEILHRAPLARDSNSHLSWN